MSILQIIRCFINYNKIMNGWQQFYPQITSLLLFRSMLTYIQNTSSEQIIRRVIGMTTVTKETIIRAIVVNIENIHNSFVVDEIITTDEFATEALEGYRDLSKFRIITV